uniref:Pseudouridine synthase RsuA/RluA-like domain-containing protein n=1 Tax=Palpitomonas bilix TaxID=652834 RepID=A0A7S3D4J4_9EUKA|mmetsp:Transcript_19525/g.50009  ORF Transcript_19525/g.50009 Transcript_19525/m.50009 type:complete len:433 (+) Transcript_19525:100-1398(+)
MQSILRPPLLGQLRHCCSPFSAVYTSLPLLRLCSTSAQTERSWQEVTVPHHLPSSRVDRFLRRYYNPLLVQSQIEKALRAKRVAAKEGVAKKKLKSSDRVLPGQVLLVDASFLPPSKGGILNGGEGKSKSQALDSALLKEFRNSILFEHEDFVVVNKPYGLAVQGGSGVRQHVDQLLSQLEVISLDGVGSKKEKMKLVHRLDKDTTGALIVARHHAAAARFQAMFAESTRGHGGGETGGRMNDPGCRFLYKKYLAVLSSPIAGPKHGVINLPLEKGNTVGKASLERMIVASEETDKNYAFTEYSQIGSGKGGIPLVEMIPRTGRTHQLRAHACYSLHSPILGDKKYFDATEKVAGKGKKDTHGISGRLHLHAAEIAFVYAHQKYIIQAPLPQHFFKTADQLGLNLPSIKSAAPFTALSEEENGMRLPTTPSR